MLSDRWDSIRPLTATVNLSRACRAVSVPSTNRSGLENNCRIDSSNSRWGRKGVLSL